VATSPGGWPEAQGPRAASPDSGAAHVMVLALAPPAESLPAPKIFLQKRLSHKGWLVASLPTEWNRWCNLDGARLGGGELVFLV